MNVTISKSEAETQTVAKTLAGNFKNGGLVLLYGDLGSGKTAFTKGFASYFSINKFQIKSPTYTYIRKYELGRQNFYHIDLYRLEIIDELLWREIAELIENKENIIVIEWADKIDSKLKNMKLKKTMVRLKYIDESNREITIE